MKVDWTDVAEIKWSKDGRLMLRKPGGEFQLARDFEHAKLGDTPINWVNCRIMPDPYPDVACVTVPIEGIRPVADGVEVKLPDGQVARLDRLFSLDTEPPTVE